MYSPAVSEAKIPASLDKKLDRQTPSNGSLNPGISIRNGPVTEDVDMKDANGHIPNRAVPAKRKARDSAVKPKYADEESSDSDVPLVCAVPPVICKDSSD